MNVKIIVAFHKDFWRYEDPLFFPIQAGASSAESKIGGVVSDSTGDNISGKNPNYCELTALYWFWKNFEGKADFYGLMHYRRYLLPSVRQKGRLRVWGMRIGMGSLVEKLIGRLWYGMTAENRECAAELLEESVSFFRKETLGTQLFVPEKLYFPCSVSRHYAYFHRKSDLMELGLVIKEMFPKMSPFFQEMCQQHWIYPCNLFVMRNDLFEKYMNFLFPVLFELEQRIPLPEDRYQARLFGFLAERLFTAFILYEREKGVKVKENAMLLLNF